MATYMDTYNHPAMPPLLCTGSMTLPYATLPYAYFTVQATLPYAYFTVRLLYRMLLYRTLLYRTATLPDDYFTGPLLYRMNYIIVRLLYRTPILAYEA